jgi:hypothetical protein
MCMWPISFSGVVGLCHFLVLWGLVFYDDVHVIFAVIWHVFIMFSSFPFASLNIGYVYNLFGK